MVARFLEDYGREVLICVLLVPLIFYYGLSWIQGRINRK
jgi:hypothetical protein